MFKALVAVACVAVIAIAVVVMWPRPDLCRDTLARLDPLAAIGPEAEDFREVLTGCMFTGRLTQADFDRHLADLRATHQPQPAARLP
jgi:hypothetical protein